MAVHRAIPHWRWVHASVRGTAHCNNATPCQDAFASVEIERPHGSTLILACADGAGSASRADHGAQWACDTLVGEVADYISSGRRTSDITSAIVDHWFLNVHRALVDQATQLDCEPRELACTLLGAVIEPDAAVFMQIGDGAIVIAQGMDYAPVFWPQSGEYANTTYFISEHEALTRVQWRLVQTPIDEIGLLTDGLQSIALTYETRTAHQPFFRPMFTRLRVESPGLSAGLSNDLAAFLASEPVNLRTDDDKTLVLATRRSNGEATDSDAPAAAAR